MHVAALFVYPVKACRGIALPHASLGKRGIAHDRRWMIVDDAGVFVTQREHPTLARVEAVVQADGSLTLSAEGHGAAQAPSASRDGPRRRVRVWKAEPDAVDAGDDAARWLSAYLARSVRLVAMPDDVERAVSPDHARPGDIVGFADGFPLLMACTASLDDLNARLPRPVPMARFRPNIVVSGSAPWDEDGWTRLRVGAVPMRVAKPCTRCAVITVDQTTGERTGAEPLATLATFRQVDSGVRFGQNLIPDLEGGPAPSVTVGDAVTLVA